MNKTLATHIRSDDAGSRGRSADEVLEETAIGDRIRYPGGKGTFFKNLINLIPDHNTYIETHLGGGAVIRNKRPAGSNIAIDIDPAVHEMWNKDNYPHILFCKLDAVLVLKSIDVKPHTFIYSDPPYLFETRKGGRLYNFEYTDDQHKELLRCLKDLSSPVVKIMISGYWSELYERELKGWRVASFETMTRGGMATEYVWMNYPEPETLHDYRYLGDTFRDRERIKRKQNRWIAGLRRMPVLERNALIERIMNEVK